MIYTILLTILLTLLGVGLVLYFIWLGVVSWKSIRFRKEATANIEELHKRVDDVISRIDDERDNMFDSLDDSTSSIWNELNSIRDDIYNIRNDMMSDLDSVRDENLENLRAENHSITNLESVINSRFDKQFNTINELKSRITLLEDNLKMMSEKKYEKKSDKKK